MSKVYEYPERTYTEKDINKAFSMGLETAVVILENAILLPPAEQRYLLNRMKKKIVDDKIAATLGSTFHQMDGGVL